MGCVLGKEGSSVVVYNGPDVGREIGDGRSKSNLSVEVSESLEVGANAVENSNGGGGGGNEVVETAKVEKEVRSKSERKKGKANPRLSNFAKNRHGEQVAAGWPPWLSDVLGEALEGWLPRRADSFEKIDKVGKFFFNLLLICIAVNG